MPGFQRRLKPSRARKGAVKAALTRHNFRRPEGPVRRNEWIETNRPVRRAVERIQMLREGLRFPAMRMVGGYFPLPDKPGIGIELSEQALAKYPFEGARPMARVFHEDGSVAEW